MLPINFNRFEAHEQIKYTLACSCTALCKDLHWANSKKTQKFYSECVYYRRHISLKWSFSLCTYYILWESYLISFVRAKSKYEKCEGSEKCNIKKFLSAMGPELTTRGVVVGLATDLTSQSLLEFLVLMWPLCNNLTLRSFTHTRSVFGRGLHTENKHRTSVSFCYLPNVDIVQYLTQCSICTCQNTLCFISSCARTYSNW